MISYLANAERFWRISGPATWAFGVLAAVSMPLGLGLGLAAAPAEQLQGDLARIMFVHVPTASLSLLAYLAMAIASFTYYIWRHPVADELARAMAPLGAGVTGVALATGAIWGHPTWGAWWVWDARLTSTFVLFLIYLGYLALRAAIDDPRQGAVAGAILCMVGAVNLPIVKYSVEWWFTLHQPASNTLGGSAMDPAFFWPLLISMVGVNALFATLTLLGARTALLRRRAQRMAAPVVTAPAVEAGS